MPWAMTSSSSMISTFAIAPMRSCMAGRRWSRTGDQVVNATSVSGLLLERLRWTETRRGRCSSRRAARRSSCSTTRAACSRQAGARGRRSRRARGRAAAAGRSARRARAMPLVVPYEVDGRHERLVYLSRGRRPRRVRGASLGLHRRGLARAADAARAAAVAARDGAAAGRGRRRARRAGARRGRADPRADRRGALPRPSSSRARASSRSAPTPVLPCSRRSSSELAERAARAGVALRVEGDEDATRSRSGRGC